MYYCTFNEYYDNEYTMGLHNTDIDNSQEYA